MDESSVYLDTSSIVKRYVEERGSRLVDRIYAEAETGRRTIAMSLWNIGEVLGAFDRCCSRRVMGEDDLRKAVGAFLAESQKMIRLGGMLILPFSAEIMTETYALILKHHIYQADALQIATCKMAGSTLFVSGDTRLLGVARDEKIRALNVEKAEEDATQP